MITNSIVEREREREIDFRGAGPTGAHIDVPKPPANTKWWKKRKHQVPKPCGQQDLISTSPTKQSVSDGSTHGGGRFSADV